MKNEVMDMNCDLAIEHEIRERERERGIVCIVELVEPQKHARHGIITIKF